MLLLKQRSAWGGIKKVKKPRFDTKMADLVLSP